MIKKSLLIVLSVVIIIFTQCASDESTEKKNINEQTVTEVQNALIDQYANADKEMIKRGVQHAASLWRTSDGTPDEFKNFCLEQFIDDAEEKKIVFKKIEKNFESLWGHQNKMVLDLNENMHLD